MIYALATRHQKKTALSLLLLFHFQLVAPNVRAALSETPRHHSIDRSNWFAVSRALPRNPWAVAPHVNALVTPEEHARQKIKFSPQIGGPGQPEMTGFKSVGSSDMVDLFTGDFSYNIPLMDVGGYPVNIHYSGGVSMDQEASWVGLGWNLNPGTVSRNVRGMPDDFNGTDSISKTQSVKANETWGVTIGGDIELAGLALKKDGSVSHDDSAKLNANPKISIGAHLGLFQNTYNGWGTEFGVNPSISAGGKSFGTLNASLSLSSNSQTGTSIQPNISFLLSGLDKTDIRLGYGLGTNFNTRSGMSSLQLNGNVRLDRKHMENLSSLISTVPSGAISFATASYTPSISMPYTSESYTMRFKMGTTAWALHPSGYVQGYYTKQEIKEVDKIQSKPAVGYLYLSAANDNSNTLMDFNRDRDLAYVPNRTPNIGIAQYTYDVYSISGEGTGGMFRPYRGDVGYIRDSYVKSKSGSKSASADLGFGYIAHVGADYAYTNSYSENNPWTALNDLAPKLRFRENDTTYQAVYFRNPGERTSNSQSFYNSIGDDALIRARLSGKQQGVRAASSFMKFNNGNYTGEVNVTTPIVKNQRDKRSQVISYLTAQEAAVYGLEKNIYSVQEDSIPGIGCHDVREVISRVDGTVRKKHHLSQITVLNGDGRRYVYGIPAYNLMQKDVSFSVGKETDPANISNGLASYNPGIDNTKENNLGKEGYFSKDSMPAYAHSFLLTAIVSPDYVDLKNDGITEDDMGDAVKFNYTRVYGNPGNAFKWRTPFNQNKVNSNEGLKTYERDDKGSYLYGEKEVWYLNSIESKTMIAVFKAVKDRKDIYSAAGENGGLDETKKMCRLQQIDLFVKADLVKSGPNARPVKTVHFSYSYALCKGVTGNPLTGKLTLDSIWFSYNGNEKGKLNPYVFKYNTINPDYNPKSYDRWGNFKNPAYNPKPNMANADYPYAQQDSAIAAQYAGAWTMDEIRLPSGGKIKLTYEADDYGFVQDKRATQFFKIAGFGATPTSIPVRELYNDKEIDNRYIFINSPVTLSNRTDIERLFLHGNDYIFFKLAVTTPTDKWGSGKEFIPIYGEVQDYGLATSGRFWLRLKDVHEEGALARMSLEFLRLNLPSKAYPGSEPGDNLTAVAIVKSMATNVIKIVSELQGYNKIARKKEFCKLVDTTQSFVRLNNPWFKKRGGGMRVKKVEVYDNWKHMTGQKESVYGQEYIYTKTETIDGRSMVISSGVASYEPAIGGEENPFHQPLPYVEKVAPGAPANHLYVEAPLGESYFPSASVGYSKVRVRTINAKAISANGWQETEFFTTRDFPTKFEHTVIDEDAKEQYNPKLSGFLRVRSVNHMTLSQGFRVELNDMNGKVKRQASFAETNPVDPVSYVNNFYKVDNDLADEKHLNNNVWTVDSLNGRLNPDGSVGKDIEIMVDLREQLSKTNSADFGVNIDYAQVGPFPWILPSSLPIPQSEQTRFRSIAVIKVVQRYGILDSVVAFDKGSVVSTKNMVYDGETGEVVLSRTNNEFNDPVYNFSYPAHWAYSGMGMAYQNADAVFSNLKLIKGVLYYGGQSTTPYPVERFFEPGDEVQLSAIPAAMQLGANCLQFTVPPVGTRKPKPVPMRAWVMDAAKAKEGDKGLYFIDGNGNPLTLEVPYIRILRSGHRNLLDASVGSIMCMANPIRAISERGYFLKFDADTRVINTSAVTYKDLWKTENFVYPVDTIYKVEHYYTKTVSPLRVTNKKLDSKNNVSATVENAPNLAASFDFTRKRDCYAARYFFTKSIMDFDLDDIPANATVLSATMSLKGRKPRGLWKDGIESKGGCGNSKSYNWTAATNYYQDGDASYLRRVVSNWNSATPYAGLISSTVNQVPINHTNHLSLGCASLIQDVIENENYGISLEIIKHDASNIHNDETNFLSFCAGAETNINQPSCSTASSNPMSCNCSAPVLTINYKSLDDSIANRCRVLGEDSIVNPYRLGLLGNWRVDRAYTFYHDRKEQFASEGATNIRKNGELKEFSTFWAFNNTKLTAAPDTSKWVWNSASSLYSKKGFEIENYDPLGRYNAGLYGYNGTLPIAVGQNTRHRQLLFDGFEDYGYKSEMCSLCETPRDIDFVSGHPGVWRTDTISHSGLYSMKIQKGFNASFTGTVVSLASADSTISLSASIDTSVASGTIYNATGDGLAADYKYWTSCSNLLTYGSTPSTIQNLGAPINFNWGTAGPVSGACGDWFTARWSGYIQVPYSDNYSFYGLSDNAMQIKINGVNVTDALTPNAETKGTEIYLQAGTFYFIEIIYQHPTGNYAKARMRWSRNGNPGKIEVVPHQYLYDEKRKRDYGFTTAEQNSSCVQAQPVKPDHFIRANFSPINNTKVVVSCWVRMDSNDCNTAPVLENVVRATVLKTSNASEDFFLKKTGVRIEGWQRYEAVFTLTNAKALTIRADAPSERDVLVDDIRVQPFSSAMKSYAYNPVNLRLMAELDENNYATFYEYDDDGTLIRVKKETERGIMTIKESRSALLKN